MTTDALPSRCRPHRGRLAIPGYRSSEHRSCAFVPESPNLLLNPAHPDAPIARIFDTRRFTFDPRLWRPR
jgi:hypothetical protein